MECGTAQTLLAAASGHASRKGLYTVRSRIFCLALAGAATPATDEYQYPECAPEQAAEASAASTEARRAAAEAAEAAAQACEAREIAAAAQAAAAVERAERQRLAEEVARLQARRNSPPF